MNHEETGREVVQDAMATLQAFFQGQSDAYWGLGPQSLYTSPRLSKAYAEGFETYQVPLANRPTAEDALNAVSSTYTGQ